MFTMPRLTWLPLVAAAMLSLPAPAEEAVPGRPLLSGAIDDGVLVALPGNLRPEAR